MLFKRCVLEAIARGEITLAFRRWKRPTVSSRARLRTAMGEVQIGSVRPISDAQLTEADARKAGFSSLAALKEDLRDGPGRRLYRIELQSLEPDRRAALAQGALLSENEAKDMAAQLARWDAFNSRQGYHREILDLVEANTGAPARALAERLGVETPKFKRDARKLKELGLTESLEVGYRLSPRGAALLKRLGR